jgi:hypothetical protein
MRATTRTIQCWRKADEVLVCNVPHTHRHHSATGFDCGHLGSGPSDLALNILTLYIPAPPDIVAKLAGHDGHEGALKRTPKLRGVSGAGRMSPR